MRQLEAGSGTIDCAQHPRLPTQFAIAAARADRRLANVAPEARWALHVLALGERVGVESPARTRASELPFQVSLDADDGLVVRPFRDIAQSKLLPDQVSHSWARGLLAPRVIVDLSDVDQVNSVLVAWLLQLAQSAKPAAMAVRNARAQIVTQLKQLRLDLMMTIG
jgi:anti-anti-sigma regulatory factor